MSLTLLLLFACRNNSHLLFRQCRERDFFIFGAFGNSLPLCHNVCHIAFAGFHFRWIFIVIIHTICILNLFHSKPYVRTSKLFFGGDKNHCNSFVGFSCFSFTTRGIDSLLGRCLALYSVRTVYPENRAGEAVRCRKGSADYGPPSVLHDQIAKWD